MLITRPQTQRGFSIVETILYIAIFALISVLVINTLMTLTRAFAETASNRNIAHNGAVVMDRMTREIKGASAVNTGASNLGSHPGSISFQAPTADGFRSVTFAVTDGNLVYTVDGVTLGNLNTSRSSISNLVFHHIITTKGYAVKIEMTVTDIRSGNSENFNTTVKLRANY